MGAPSQPPQPFDAGNGLLSQQPAQLTTTLLDGPQGQVMALTVRTPTTTLTVLLSKTDARSWAASIKRAADAMSDGGLIIANGQGAGDLRGRG